MIVPHKLDKKLDISSKEISLDFVVYSQDMNYNFLYRDLGSRIEKLRKQKGLTQEELAVKAGLHRAYFWDIENGRNISIKTAYKIARGLGVKLSELFDF